MIKKFHEYFNDSSIGEGDRKLMPETIRFDKIYPEELELLDLPLEQRQLIKTELKMQLNEGIMSNIRNFLSRKMMSWLINRNEKEIRNTVDLLTIFDPTDFSNVKKSEIIYLGGGMDAVKDGGKSWRQDIGQEFGVEHVVNTEDVFKLGYTDKFNMKKYPKPIIFDPTIKEVIREDPEFVNIWKKLKNGEIVPDDLKYMAKTINKEITNPDLRIVNKCDTIFARLDGTQGPGTLGELQIGTLLRQNIFVWLTGNYQLKNLNLWIIPEINKIIRTDEEVSLLINSIKKKNL